MTSPSVHVIWERGKGGMSDMIARVSKVKGMALADTPSHVLILFSDGVGYEAHAHTCGWEIIRREQLEQRHRSGAMTYWRWSPSLHTTEVLDLRTKAHMALGMHDYDEKNIVRLWANRRLRAPVFKSPARWICSEGVGRIMYPWVDWRQMVRDTVDHRVGCKFDMLTPANMLAAVWHSPQRDQGLP